MRVASGVVGMGIWFRETGAGLCVAGGLLVWSAGKTGVSPYKVVSVILMMCLLIYGLFVSVSV